MLMCEPTRSRCCCVQYTVKRDRRYTTRRTEISTFFFNLCSRKQQPTKLVFPPCYYICEPSWWNILVSWHTVVWNSLEAAPGLFETFEWFERSKFIMKVINLVIKLGLWVKVWKCDAACRFNQSEPRTAGNQLFIHQFNRGSTHLSCYCCCYCCMQQLCNWDQTSSPLFIASINQSINQQVNHT